MDTKERAVTVPQGITTGLWSQLTKDVRKAVAGLVDRRTVLDLTDDGRVEIVGSDPANPGPSRIIPRLRGLEIDAGDDVITLTIGGGELVIGAIATDNFSSILDRLAALEGLVNPVTRGVASGYYYGPMTTLSGYAINNVVLAANTLRLAPFLCPAAATFNQIGVEVTTAATAGGTIQFGIYDIGPDGLARNLIADLGTVDTTATGYRPSPAISLTLPRGLYWIGGATNQTVTIRQLNGTGMTTVIGQSGTTGISPISAISLTIPSGFSTLPATISAPNGNFYVPAFQLRAA